MQSRGRAPPESRISPRAGRGRRDPATRRCVGTSSTPEVILVACGGAERGNGGDEGVGDRPGDWSVRVSNRCALALIWLALDGGDAASVRRRRVEMKAMFVRPGVARRRRTLGGCHAHHSSPSLSRRRDRAHRRFRGSALSPWRWCGPRWAARRERSSRCRAPRDRVPRGALVRSRRSSRRLLGGGRSPGLPARTLGMSRKAFGRPSRLDRESIHRSAKGVR
jgi:hypothetical protein